MSILGQMIPEYAEIYEEDGLQGVLDAVMDLGAIEPWEAATLLMNDPFLADQEEIDQGTIDFFETPGIVQILNANAEDGGPYTMIDMQRILESHPDYTTAAGYVWENIFQPLLSRTPAGRQVVQAATMLNVAHAAVESGSSYFDPNSALGGAFAKLTPVMAGLKNYGIPLLTAGAAAYTIWQAGAMVNNWWNSKTPEEKKTVSVEEKEAFDTVNKFIDKIKSSKVIDKDIEMATELAKKLTSQQFSRVEKNILNKEYENHVLSVLARQLKQVMQDKLPLSEFSSFEAKRRAVSSTYKYPGTIPEGNPSSVIGI